MIKKKKLSSIEGNFRSLIKTVDCQSVRLSVTPPWVQCGAGANALGMNTGLSKGQCLTVFLIISLLMLVSHSHIIF